MIRNEDRIRLIFCLSFPVILGLLTGILNFKGITYVCNKMKSPPLAAPALLMTLLWLIAYIAIGLGAFLIATSHVYREEKLMALGICAGALILHSVWVIVFFTHRLFILGFLIHLLYTAATLLNTLFFYKTEERAGLLLLPASVFSIYYLYINITMIFIR